MPYIYSFGDYEIETPDELDTPQLQSLVDQAEGKPFKSTELERQIERFGSKQELGRLGTGSRIAPPIPNPFDYAKSQMGAGSQALTTGMRVGGNVLGQVGGGIIGGLAGTPADVATGPAGTAAGAFAGSRIGGALGSAIGDAGAQGYEMLAGARENYNPWMTGLEGAMGAIPGSKAASMPARVGIDALLGAGQGMAGEAGRVITEENRLPEFSDVAIPGVVGAALSGGAGAYGLRSERKGVQDLADKFKLRSEAREAANSRLQKMDLDTQEGFGRVRGAAEQEALRVQRIGEAHNNAQKIRYEELYGKINAAKQDIHDNADQAVEMAVSKSKEKWIENEILNRKKNGKTIKQIRQEAEDMQGLNRPAQNAVRVAAMRRYAKEMGLNPEDIDGSLYNKFAQEHGFRPVEANESQFSPIDESNTPSLSGQPLPKVGPPPGSQNLGSPSNPAQISHDLGDQLKVGQDAFSGLETPDSTALDKTELSFDPSDSTSGATVPQLMDRLRSVLDTAQGKSVEPPKAQEVGGGWKSSKAPETADELARRSASAKLAANDTAELAHQMSQSENPLVRDILENHPDAVGDLSERIPTAQTFWDRVVTSRRQKLENIGGKEVVRNIQIYEREVPQIASDLSKRTDDVFAGLGDDKTLAESRWNNVLERRQNPTIKPLDQAADVAYEKMRQLDKYKKDLWQQANLDPDKLITTPKPMSYDVGFWGNSNKIQDALKERYPLLTNDSVRYIANGASNLDDAADAALSKNMAQAAGNKEWALQKFRELNAKRGVNVPEHLLMSELDLPGYKSGVEAVKQDNIGFAERVAKTKMGDMEQLYAQTHDPKLARDLANEIIGFSMHKPSEQSIGKINQIVGRYATARMLGSYMISNLSNVSGTILEAGAKRTLVGLTKILTSKSARQSAQKVAEEAGTSVDLSRGMLQELQGNDFFGKFMKVGGWTKQIEVAENMMRTLNAAVGREYSQSLFGKLKAGEATQDEINKLMRYTLAKSPQELLNQKELTEKQLRYAAYGFTEKTQGTRSALNVSQTVGSENEILRMMNAFRRYTYQSTKLVKDSIVGPDLTKTERMRNVTRLVLASQAMGEITGDAKALVKGGTMDIADEFRDKKDTVNHTKKEVMERGEWLNYALRGWTGGHEMPHALNRLLDNAIQGWMLGTVADLALSGAGGAGEMLSTFAGPVATDLTTVAGGLGEIASNVLHGKKVTVPDRFKRQTIRSVPIIGSGLAGAVAPTQRESGRNQSAYDYFVRDAKNDAKVVTRGVKKLFR